MVLILIHVVEIKLLLFLLLFFLPLIRAVIVSSTPRAWVKGVVLVMLPF
jgi:hypothetical protein